MHPALDPLGVTVRESRDSAEHPESLAIAVLFDVTGSMGGVPRVLQAKLPQLLGLLLRKGYAEDPQIMFGAIGDATCDRAPLQVGQFESDNRMDDDLGRILLEGGGGGQKTESYELAMYFMARHTAIDCYDKRGQRGYLFLIGDELAYPQVKPAEVRDVIGDGLQAALPLPRSDRELTATLGHLLHPPGGRQLRRRPAGARLLARPARPERHRARRPGRGLRDDRADRRASARTRSTWTAGLADLGDVGSAAGPAVRRALAAIGSGPRVLELAPPDMTVPMRRGSTRQGRRIWTGRAGTSGSRRCGGRHDIVSISASGTRARARSSTGLCSPRRRSRPVRWSGSTAARRRRTTS